MVVLTTFISPFLMKSIYGRVQSPPQVSEEC